MLEECGDYECLEELPKHLKPYVTIDVEQMARDCACDLSVLDSSDGGVYLFDMSR